MVNRPIIKSSQYKGHIFQMQCVQGLAPNSHIFTKAKAC